MKQYALPNSWYDWMKWAGLVFLPAAATLYGILAQVWGLPYGEQVVATINAIGVFIGTIIGISHLTAKEADDAR